MRLGKLDVSGLRMHVRVWRRVWVPDGLHVWWGNRGVHAYWSRPHIDLEDWR